LIVAPAACGAPLFASLLALVPLQERTAPAESQAKAGDAEGSKRKSAGERSGPWALPGWPEIRFKDVAKSAGIDCTNLSGQIDKPRLIDTLGCGMCWFDYDGDGWLDLFIPNGSTLEAVLGLKVKVTQPDGSVTEETPHNDVSDRLYRNRGDGTFEDVTEKAGLKDDRWGVGVAAGDYDNDGDEDLYVCNIGCNFLYRNNGDGTFTDVAAEAGVDFEGVTPGAGWGDIDGDGDLDLYVSCYLEYQKKKPWPPFAKTMRGMRVMQGPQGLVGGTDKLFRNEGDGKFTDVTAEAGLRTAEREYGFTIQMVDLNEDDLVDIFVANDMTPNHHYRQVKPCKFTPCGSISGLSVDHDGTEKACMGVALADLNDDQIPDFFITNFSAQTNDLYLSQGENSWNENPNPTEKVRTAMPFVGWGTGFFDLDLDGDEDLIAFNGHVFPQVDSERPRVQDYRQYPLLYRRDGPLKFSDAATTPGADFYAERSCRGAGFADYDEDGDVDVALFEIDRPALLLRNETDAKGHHVKVLLLGTTINRDAYGSRIVLEAEGRRQTRWVLGQGSFISQNDRRAHFGLGLAGKVDRITVRWTGGKEEVIEGPKGPDGKPAPLAVDRTFVVKEGMGLVGELPAGQVWTRAMTAALAAAPAAGGAAAR